MRVQADDGGGADDGERAPKAYGNNVSLQDLVEGGVLVPGKGVLTVHYRQSQWRGDLLPSGEIESEGQRFSKPTTFAAAMVQRVNPSLKSKNGWEAIYYEGKCAPRLACMCGGVWAEAAVACCAVVVGGFGELVGTRPDRALRWRLSACCAEPSLQPRAYPPMLCCGGI